MIALYIKLITALTAIVAILQAQHATPKIIPHVFGGTIPTLVQEVPDDIQGFALYDTPSGNLDAGFYTMQNGNPYAHLASQITATTTVPDGFYQVKDTTGLTLATQVGEQYTFYDATGKVLGTSADQSIGIKMTTKDAALPTIGVLQ